MNDTSPVFSIKAPFSDVLKMSQLLLAFEGHCKQLVYSPTAEEFQLIEPDDELGKIAEANEMKMTLASGTSFPLLGR